MAVYNHYKRIFNESSLPKWLVLLFFTELHFFSIMLIDCMYVYIDFYMFLLFGLLGLQEIRMIM